TMPIDVRDARVERIVLFVGGFQASFEAACEHDPRWLWYLAPLESVVELLLIDQPDRRELAIAAGVAAKAELENGSMTRGERLLLALHDTFERVCANNASDAEAQRILSAALNMLGDFYIRRGQPGDAERALAAFEKSNETFERLLASNPGSASAARDVSVSHFMLARLHGQAGNEPGVQHHLSRCFAILDGFHKAGRPMDPQMRQLHAQLTGMMGSAGSSDGRACRDTRRSCAPRLHRPSGG
ncbi:MAG: hypothetical protein ABL908_16720, partial [Hyphomicrobium sp.]